MGVKGVFSESFFYKEVERFFRVRRGYFGVC